MNTSHEITKIYEAVAVLRYIESAIAHDGIGGGLAVIISDQCVRLERVADKLEQAESRRRVGEGAG